MNMKANLVLSSLHHASNGSSFDKIQLVRRLDLKATNRSCPPKALSALLQLHQPACREWYRRCYSWLGILPGTQKSPSH